MRRLAIVSLCFACIVSVIADDHGEALRNAARSGDLATVKRLVEQGVDVDSATRYGATSLSYAADKGHLEVVRYLIEKGADVNVTDTFYKATPISWASFSEHVDVIALLLESGATGADGVLTQGMRSGNLALVEAALGGSDLTAGAVERALTAARTMEEGAPFVALLEKVEIEAPVREAVEVDAATLGRYVGTFKNAELGMQIDVRLEDDTLIAQAVGQGPLTMRPLSETRYEAIEFPQVQIAFAGRGELIERLIVYQGGQEMTFPRAAATDGAATDEATAEAEAGAEASAEPTAIADTPAAAPAKPVKRERAAARPWPSFRGAGASGNGDGQGAPLTWNVETGENVLWKTAIPGVANSSPIIWGDRVFVTTAISAAGDDSIRTGLYGDVDSVEDLSEHTFKVYALDRTKGTILWERTAGTAVPGAKRHLKSTQANSTPVTDGKRVVALFGTIGLLVAYDMDGTKLWSADVGVLDAGWFYDETYQWGHASSPVIHDGLVFVQADLYADSFIAAYRLKDGSRAWKTSRDEIPTWGSPTIHRGPDRDELITNGTTIRGYDPKTGEQLWSLGPNSEVTVATPIVADGMIYVTAGYPPVRPIYAIRQGASGDLTLPEGESSGGAVAWSHSRGGTYMPTPVVYEGRLYTCANDGRLTAYDASTGERIYRQRVGSGTYTASPIAADGRLYFTTEEGDIVVARAGDTYEELARNEMDAVCMSTPAVSGGVLVVRTADHVYGLGEGEPATQD